MQRQFDENDPLRKPKYMPRYYPVNVLFEVDPGTGQVNAGAISAGSVTINNADFLLRKITANVIGLSNIDYAAAGFPAGSSALDFNAGPIGWTFSWRTDSHVYMSDQCDVIAAIGSNQDYFDTPSPVILRPKSTVSMDVTSTLPRTQQTQLQFVLHGIEPAEAYPERL